jgi:hypothetical protein
MIFQRLRRLLMGPNTGQWDEDPVNLQPDKLASKTRLDYCVGCPGIVIKEGRNNTFIDCYAEQPETCSIENQKE